MDKPKIVIEAHVKSEMNEYISRTAGAVLEAKKKKMAAKETLDTALEKNKEYCEALEMQDQAKEAKKTAKEKAVINSQILKQYQEAYKEASEDLKGAEESLDGALEAHFKKTGDFKVESPSGTTVVMKRKFSLGAKQLSFFE